MVKVQLRCLAHSLCDITEHEGFVVCTEASLRGANHHVLAFLLRKSGLQVKEWKMRHYFPGHVPLLTDLVI